jgi:hypothetical protein
MVPKFPIESVNPRCTVNRERSMSEKEKPGPETQVAAVPRSAMEAQLDRIEKLLMEIRDAVVGKPGEHRLGHD